MARKYAHRIPFIVKINHNELLTYPNHYDQILFGNVKQAFDMELPQLGQQFTLGLKKAIGKLKKLARPFSMRMNLEWQLFSGVI